MKRAGFTMIELIFVIVILGILAAVALPKFAGVSDSAQVGKLSAFVGTLNRSAGPAMWSQTMTDPTITGAAKGTNAALLAAINPVTGVAFVVEDFVDIPDSIPAGTFSIAGCAGAGSAPVAGSNEATSGIIIGTKTYGIGCSDGDNTQSPRFWLDDGTTIIAQ